MNALVIIGAGIVGAACALATARAGLRPWVVDAGQPGMGASAEGMGHVLALDHDPATLALTRRSLELWHDLAPELPAAAQWSGAGTLWLGEDAAELAHAEAQGARLRALGLDAQLIGRDRLHALEPELDPRLPGALRVADDRIVYPPVVAAWLLARARDHGARVILDAPVAQVESICEGEAIKGERVVFIDPKRPTILAESVLVAAGLGSRALLPPALSGFLVPRRGHLLISTATSVRIRHQLVELGYHASVADRGAARVAFNLQPRPGGQLLLGSSREDDNPSREVCDSTLARMVARSLAFVPGLAQVEGLRAWVGLRPATRDGLPLIGPVPDRPGLVLACGHEGLGITTALATAELCVAALGLGPSGLDPRPFSPARAFDVGADHAA